jgi:hypothetical protein
MIRKKSRNIASNVSAAGLKTARNFALHNNELENIGHTILLA